MLRGARNNEEMTKPVYVEFINCYFVSERYLQLVYHSLFHMSTRAHKHAELIYCFVYWGATNVLQVNRIANTYRSRFAIAYLHGFSLDTQIANMFSAMCLRYMQSTH